MTGGKARYARTKRSKVCIASRDASLVPFSMNFFQTVDLVKGMRRWAVTWQAAVPMGTTSIRVSTCKGRESVQGLFILPETECSGVACVLSDRVFRGLGVFPQTDRMFRGRVPLEIKGVFATRAVCCSGTSQLRGAARSLQAASKKPQKQKRTQAGRAHAH